MSAGCRCAARDGSSRPPPGWSSCGGGPATRPTPPLRDRVADAWIGARAYQLHTHATAARLAAGGTLGAEASLGKVFWSELDIALHETALDLLGPRAEVRGGPDGRWLDGYLFALAGPDLRGHQRDPAHGDRRAAAAAAPVHSLDQHSPDEHGPDERLRAGAVRRVLHDMLAAADVPAAARRWADGDLAPGLALWRRLADLGVTALAVPEKWGGLGASPLDLAVACEELGHHAVPGPVAESLAAGAGAAGRAGGRG